MRPFDPFDKYVDDPINNPNHYTFDTAYGYALDAGNQRFLRSKIYFKVKKIALFFNVSALFLSVSDEDRHFF